MNYGYGFGGNLPPGYTNTGYTQPQMPEAQVAGYVDAYGYGPGGGAARVGVNGLLLPPEAMAEKPHEAAQYLKLSPNEEQTYGALWAQASGGNDRAPAKSAGAVLARAENLSRPQLRMIWNIADHQHRGALGRDEFYIALRLIALSQRGAEPSVQGLRNFAGIQLIPKMSAAGTTTQGSAERPQSQTQAPPVAAQTPPVAAQAPQKGASMPHDSGSLWIISREQKQKYDKLFQDVDTARSGYINGQQAVEFFGKSGLPRPLLRHVWGLSDRTQDGRLDLQEFCNAVHLIKLLREKRLRADALPNKLDPNGLTWVRVEGEQSPAASTSVQLPQGARDITLPTKGANVSRRGPETTQGNPHMSQHFADVPPPPVVHPQRSVPAAVTVSSEEQPNVEVKQVKDQTAEVNVLPKSSSDRDVGLSASVPSRKTTAQVQSAVTLPQSDADLHTMFAQHRIDDSSKQADVSVAVKEQGAAHSAEAKIAKDDLYSEQSAPVIAVRPTEPPQAEQTKQVDTSERLTPPLQPTLQSPTMQPPTMQPTEQSTRPMPQQPPMQQPVTQQPMMQQPMMQQPPMESMEQPSPAMMQSPMMQPPMMQPPMQSMEQSTPPMMQPPMMQPPMMQMNYPGNVPQAGMPATAPQHGSFAAAAPQGNDNSDDSGDDFWGSGVQAPTGDAGFPNASAMSGFTAPAFGEALGTAPANPSANPQMKRIPSEEFDDWGF